MAQCINPYQSKNGQFPCGKCHECRNRRISQWAFRLEKEAEQSCSAFFLTLTYEICPLTENGEETLCKEDIQLFIKRLRKKNSNKLKYFVCGEYGGRTQRPHYHMILFNANIDTIETAWKYEDNKKIQKMGHVHFGTVENASMVYTLKYMCKDAHKEDDTREKVFALMSKGLGKNYLTKNMVKWHKKHIKGIPLEEQAWVNRMYVNLKDGKKIAMPRYYKDKIYTKLERQVIGSVQDRKQYQHDVNKTLEQVAKDMERETLIRINKFHKTIKRNTKL